MASAPPNRNWALQRRTAGLVIVILGGLVFVSAVGRLDWFEAPKVVSVGGTLSVVRHGATLWNLTGHQAGIVTVIAGATVRWVCSATPS